jgi:MurNAc alpha-1-phosphate uridylyltransferase
MRDHPTALMMFAAGFGTRMKHLTKDQPKPMIKVAGTALIDHSLALAKGAGCDPIVANLHYKPDVLARHLEGSGVTTLTELPDILETGGGLRNALPVLGNGPVYTMNTDAVWAGPNPIKQLAEAWNPDEMDALLMCIPTAQAVGHEGTGDFTLGADGRIIRGPGVVYSGVQIIKTDLLKDITKDAFSLNLIWNEMFKDNRMFGLSYPGKWCDVGHPDGITLAENMLAQTDV